MRVVQILRGNSTGFIMDQVRCKVKWFNLQKGYGFLAPLDGSADVFMHFSVLEQAGYQTVSTGDEVICEVGAGRCGVQALKVLEIKPCLSEEESHSLSGTVSSSSQFEEHWGTVKWFNVLKGYGFIQPDDGGRDIFVHTALLRGLGVDRLRLPPGKRVCVKVLSNERGREARHIYFDETSEDTPQDPHERGNLF